MIRKYLQRRAERRKTRQYIEGFKWAMAALFIERMRYEIVLAKVYGGTHPFDLGANRALEIIAEMSRNG